LDASASRDTPGVGARFGADCASGCRLTRFTSQRGRQRAGEPAGIGLWPGRCAGIGTGGSFDADTDHRHRSFYRSLSRCIGRRIDTGAGGSVDCCTGNSRCSFRPCVGPRFDSRIDTGAGGSVDSRIGNSGRSFRPCIGPRFDSRVGPGGSVDCCTGSFSRRISRQIGGNAAGCCIGPRIGIRAGIGCRRQPGHWSASGCTSLICKHSFGCLCASEGGGTRGGICDGRQPGRAASAGGHCCQGQRCGQSGSSRQRANSIGTGDDQPGSQTCYSFAICIG